MSVTLGDRLVDDYLNFVATRVRPNTLLAHAYDLKVFFSVVTKQPTDVTPLDVLDFIKAQRQPRVRTVTERTTEFELLSTPTPIQRRIFELLGAPVPRRLM
jgi:hypothetical protein